LPGHAHADTLSFELAINDQRVIVNSGTSLYGISNERARQRSTSAHSTVEVDNSNSSEVWSGFRVAKRARPFNLICDFNGYPVSKKFRIECSHDGYLQTNKNVTHTRIWELNDKKLNIRDSLIGNSKSIVSRFYFHPTVDIVLNGSEITASDKGKRLVNLNFNFHESIEIIDSTYHDKFGTSKPNKCVVLKAKSPCVLLTEIDFL
jgi:uncharacterized heparinase superfamily protein